MPTKLKTKQTPVAAAIPTLPQKPIIPSVFDALPDGAFIREAQLVQSNKRPDIPAPVPFSSATLWRKVRAGSFPKPIKLSERITAWKVGHIRQWLTAQGEEK